MPFYHPFTDAKTNGEATEGDRHVELHGPLCGAAEEVAREGGAVRRGTRRAERDTATNDIQLGIWTLLSSDRKVPGACRDIRYRTAKSATEKIILEKLPNFGIFLLTSAKIGHIIPLSRLGHVLTSLTKPVPFVPQA